MQDNLIGDRIKQLRKTAAMTQNELAAKLQAQGTKASTKHIYLWETGTVPQTEYVMGTRPRLRRLHRLHPRRHATGRRADERDSLRASRFRREAGRREPPREQ